MPASLPTSLLLCASVPLCEPPMSHPKCPPNSISAQRKPPRAKSASSIPKPPRESFQVVIQCENETEQEQLYHEFRSRGMTVRLLTM
jgi:hypothetical protein